MKSLARLVVSGRWQAVAVATASGVMAFMLPPFSSVLNYLAAAVVALVTLHVGVLPGLQVLLLAATLTVLFYQLVGVQAAIVLTTVTLLWLPCWLLGMVLRQTRDLGAALKAASLFGVCLLLVIYGAFGDPAPWWVERLHELQQALAEAGIELGDLAGVELMQAAASLLTGLILASVVLGVISGLLLARWWQSVIVKPGAFREEFLELRLGNVAGLVTLCIMLSARLTEGVFSEFSAQAAMIMLAPYLLAGLAVVHSLVGKTGRSVGWLVAVYVLLALVPQAMLVLASGGLLDTWVDFRRRLDRGGQSSKQ